MNGWLYKLGVIYKLHYTFTCTVKWNLLPNIKLGAYVTKSYL